jgi:hypothetical protein
MYWSAQSIQQRVQYEIAGLKKRRFAITRTIKVYDSFGNAARKGACKMALKEDLPEQGF